MVGRQSWRSGSGWETLPDIRKLSVDPPGDPELVGRPTRRSGSPDHLRRSGTGRETQPRSVTGQETHTEVRK